MKIKINNNVRPWYVVNQRYVYTFIVNTDYGYYEITSFSAIKHQLDQNKTKYVLQNICMTEAKADVESTRLQPCIILCPEEHPSHVYTYTYRCKITPKLFIYGMLIKYIYYNKYCIR